MGLLSDSIDTVNHIKLLHVTVSLIECMITSLIKLMSWFLLMRTWNLLRFKFCEMWCFNLFDALNKDIRLSVWSSLKRFRRNILGGFDLNQRHHHSLSYNYNPRMEGNNVWLWKCGFDAQNSSDSGFLCEFRTTELTAKSFQKYLHSTFSQYPTFTWQICQQRICCHKIWKNYPL